MLPGPAGLDESVLSLNDQTGLKPVRPFTGYHGYKTISAFLGMRDFFIFSIIVYIVQHFIY